MEIEKRKEENEILKEALTTYNNILKVDGEEMIINHVGVPHSEFELTTYQNKIRPILYKKYHLIHSNVAKLVRNIDDIIQRCNYYEEVEEEDNAILMRNYSEMIQNIRMHIYEYRSDK